jgi:hypothetical protein
LSVDDVREAGEVLTVADRSAFAAAAEVSQREGPDRAQRHFERTASVQIAGAPALDSGEREAAITIASAKPEVVRQAFERDYRSLVQDDPTRHGYDRDLFDRQGGLERFREKSEGERGAPQSRPPHDEGLPF